MNQPRDPFGHPGTDAPAPYLGQVVGDGCVYPAPTATSHGAETIGNQLDALSAEGGPHLTWREYAEDMGNNPLREFFGTPDPLGGTDCAHPPIGGTDNTNTASPTDQFATRHVGFLYFHSVIDDRAYCDQHVVPLGTVTVGQNGAPDVFHVHLAGGLLETEQHTRLLLHHAEPLQRRTRRRLRRAKHRGDTRRRPGLNESPFIDGRRRTAMG